MCYDDQARPPAPPGASTPAQGVDVVLTASDGNRFAAYAALPQKPTGAQIIIYPDVRGLHQFYKELALRFGEVGVTAIALDYFGRTAGLTSREEPFEYMPHVQQIKLPTFYQDVHAAIAYLREKAGPGTGTFVVGFCMGGTLTLLSATDVSFGFAGVIPFYSGLTRDFGGTGTVLDNAEKVKYPVLGLYGGADQGIPESAVKQLDEKLDATKMDHNLIIYPGAPHSFFDRRAAEYADASADAWRQVLNFISTHQHKAA